MMLRRERGFEFASQWVRAGAQYAEAKAVFEGGLEFSFKLDPKGKLDWKSNPEQTEAPETRRLFPEALLSLVGRVPEPLILPGLMFFHSYRKVQEGNPELGMLIDDPDSFRSYPRRTGTLSAFKAELLKLMMGDANLFESLEDASEGSRAELEKLLKTYANASLGKLKPDRGSALDIRLVVGESRDTISFDGLSSGQKEIISTLFLIAHQSRRGNSVLCLIDEPELHLNAEWHAQLVRDLHRLVPRGQFILASHSEQIFGQVDRDHRILLESD